MKWHQDNIFPSFQLTNASKKKKKKKKKKNTTGGTSPGEKKMGMGVQPTLYYKNMLLLFSFVLTFFFVSFYFYPKLTCLFNHSF